MPSVLRLAERRWTHESLDQPGSSIAPMLYESTRSSNQWKRPGLKCSHFAAFLDKAHTRCAPARAVLELVGDSKRNSAFRRTERCWPLSL